jgi:SAM-dependent methyltransferase
MSKVRKNPERATAPEEPSVGRDPRPGMRSLARAELFGTVFVTGAAVMTIEILGTRIVGPVFGVNLFVWSALLAVTLGSLAVGYYTGGVLVDRAPAPRLLGGIVAVAGVLLGIVPALSHAVLRSAESLGPRGGSLLAAMVLFTPCLVLLGMIGPVAVRLATTDLRAAGHGVGSVYAMSTAGSLAGTLVTGFLVVPVFETSQILFGTAMLLTLLGAGSLAWHWRSAALVAVVVPLLARGVGKSPLPAGIEVRDHAQSLYGLVEVIDDSNRNVRFLRADHSIIGAQLLPSHEPGFSFIYALEAVRFLKPNAKRMLQIGLGIGSLPAALNAQGITVDVVEIDPAVIRFASQYFGFATQGEIHEEDARTFLRRTERRYDVIVHDTFTGGTTPEHLLSLEVVQRVHDLLQPGGVLALNFVGYQDGPKAEASWAVARTLRAVFPIVRTFRDGAPDGHGDSAGNLLFFASDSVMNFAMPANARFSNSSCEHVLRSLQDWEVLKQVPEGPVITDANNPLARLQLPVAEEHFRAMNELLPVEVWIHQ